MQRRTWVLLAAAAISMGTATSACSDDDENEGASGTTSTAVQRSTTTAPTTRPSGPAQTPDAAAKGFFDSWMRGDRDGASRYAKPQPIEELFSQPNTNDVEYVDQGCAPQGGQFVCSWTYPGGALQMTVEAWPGGGFVVDDVTYLVD